MVQVPKSPIITPEAIHYLESNGLLKPSKRKRSSFWRLHKPKNSTPSTIKEKQPPKKEEKKRETFKETTLRLLKEEGKLINREQLVKKAIKENPPKSQRPEWIYNDVIRKLRNDRLVAISEERLKKEQQVSLK